jgi:hypothetical protein
MTVTVAAPCVVLKQKALREVMYFARLAPVRPYERCDELYQARKDAGSSERNAIEPR